MQWRDLGNRLLPLRVEGPVQGKRGWLALVCLLLLGVAGGWVLAGDGGTDKAKSPAAVRSQERQLRAETKKLEREVERVRK